MFQGLSVLEVIKNEKLISSANRVGRTLQQGLQELKDRYVYLFIVFLFFIHKLNQITFSISKHINNICYSGFHVWAM